MKKIFLIPFSFLAFLSCTYDDGPKEHVTGLLPELFLEDVRQIEQRFSLAQWNKLLINDDQFTLCFKCDWRRCVEYRPARVFRETRRFIGFFLEMTKVAPIISSEIASIPCTEIDT